MKQKTTSQTNTVKEDRSCPCLYLDEPCHPMCTCKNGASSLGCLYCCTYGSIEQRTEKAKWLSERIKKVKEDKPERDESKIPTNIPDGENDWPMGADTYTRQEVFKLLFTQRAMISNDLKTYCGNELTKEMFDIIEKPRTPQF